MSYIIYKGELIAKTDEYLKSGSTVEFSHTLTKERINANREYQLVNADYAKISNAKKWEKIYREGYFWTAKLINNDGLYPEFQVFKAGPLD